MGTIARIRTTLNYGSGGPGLNTIYWVGSAGAPVAADALDMVNRVRAMWLAMAPAFVNTYTLQVQSDVALLNDLNGALVGQLTPAQPAVVVGTGGTAGMPIAAMALVRLRTGQVVDGRLLTGRWFLGPVASGIVNTAGQISAAQQAVFNTPANALLTGGTTASKPVVWHRPSPSSGGTNALITNCSTWNELAVMTSRRDA